MQTGGSFDIDYEVKDPDGVVMNSGLAEKDAEFVFSVDVVGEYSFCFSNAMSTFAHKVVNFDILLSGESKTVTKQTTNDADEGELRPIQASIDAVRDGLVKIERTLNFYRTREKVRQTTAIFVV